MKKITFFVVFAFVVAVTGFSQANLQPAATVSLIRTETITVGQLRTEVERIERSMGQSLNGQQRREVLDGMINERLMLQAAERDRIGVTENELNMEINQLRAQMVPMLGRQPTEAEFATAIRNEFGLEMPIFREQTRRQLIQQRYLFSQKQSLLESATPPTESEIVSMFELTRAQFVRPEMVRISVIQVPYGPDAASRTRARQQVDELHREINNNANRFAEVLLRSQAPNSTFQGGDAGFIERNLETAQRVGQDFVNLVFGMRPGEISRVLERPTGFQILKITEAHTMRNLGLEDVIHPGTNITLRAHIANAMMQERQMRVLVQATQELHAELRRGRTFQIFDANLNW